MNLGQRTFSRTASDYVLFLPQRLHVGKTVHTCIHVHRHTDTDTTDVRRKAWFPAKTSSFNLLAHGSVLVWTRFFRASESNEQYVCTCYIVHTCSVLVDVAVGWALRGSSSLLPVKNLSRWKPISILLRIILHNKVHLWKYEFCTSILESWVGNFEEHA